jgi:hypothetical protein
MSKGPILIFIVKGKRIMQQDTNETIAQLNEQELQEIAGGMCAPCGELSKEFSKLAGARFGSRVEEARALADKASASAVENAPRGRQGVCSEYPKLSSKLVELRGY